jgi:hypothetical protein
MNDISDVLDRKGVTQGLTAIAWQVRRWLDWHKSHRDKDMLVTDDDTHIMGLPVPFWPSHGQFEAWIKTMNNATAAIDEMLAALKKAEAVLASDKLDAVFAFSAVHGCGYTGPSIDLAEVRAAIAKAEGREPALSLSVDKTK